MMASSQPCWTVMLAFDAPLKTALHVIRNCEAIGWAANNRAKPGRTGPEAWVIQGSAAWSEQHLEYAPEAIVSLLTAELSKELEISLPEPLTALAHRWRYAMSAGTGHQALWNNRLMIGACGDWLIGPRVESAWMSGTALGERVHRSAVEPNIQLNAA
jgi:renalase